MIKKNGVVVNLRLLSHKPKFWESIVIFCLAAGAASLLSCGKASKPVWYVEEGLEDEWANVLAQVKNPPEFTGIEVYTPGTKEKAGSYGYLITRRDPAETGGGEVRMYQRLSRSQEYEGGLVLALDPWIVFRYNTDSPLSWERAGSPENGEGILYFPGAEEDAAAAWTAQLVQEQPGLFPEDEQAWAAVRESLYTGKRFQRGVPTYRWEDAWVFFRENRPSWVYAPYSRVRRLPGYQTSLFSADVFPLRPGWTRYGIQADILWARPFGGEEDREKLVSTEAWLKNGEVQFVIASVMNWIPASRNALPFNAFSQAAQNAWFSSAFVWQLNEVL
ncbi:MAG: hypothetical protein LBC62_04050 [Treponema sp.]|jgi:hypothetical protein|nr:hypothetical protein [Treponema sp.]